LHYKLGFVSSIRILDLASLLASPGHSTTIFTVE
jgi:hypothetical protein